MGEGGERGGGGEGKWVEDRLKGFVWLNERVWFGVFVSMAVIRGVDL